MAAEFPKAEYKQLGKSGLRVSVPILGAMSIGDKRWQQWVTEENEALPLLKAAWDRGLNTWDTANVYSNGYADLGIIPSCFEPDLEPQGIVYKLFHSPRFLPLDEQC